MKAGASFYDHRSAFDDETASNEILSGRQHPNITKYFGTFSTDGLVSDLGMVLEYADGGSLESYRDRQGPLRKGKDLWLLCDCAEALKYLGEHNIVHLDIKPANFLIDKKKTRVC